VIAPGLAPPPAAPALQAPVYRSPGERVLTVRVAVLVLAWMLTLLQLTGGNWGEVAAMASFAIAGVLAFLADRRYLGALLVLCIPALGLADTTLTPDGSQGFSLVFPDAVTFVVLGGVQVTSALVTLVAGFSRVLLEALRRPSTFRGVCPPLVVLAYAVAVIPALLSGLEGQAAGLNRWSVGVRAMLALGGFFWGVVLVRSSRAEPEVHAQQLLRVVLAGSGLAVVGLLRGTYLFVLVGLAGGALVYFVSRRRGLAAALTGTLAVASVVVLTLTTAAEIAFALLCVALTGPGMRRARRFLVRAAVLGAGVTSLGLLWAVEKYSRNAVFVATTRDQGLMGYAYFKLMGDRGPIWVSALSQVLSGPYVIVPAGRPLRPAGIFTNVFYTWEYGAHNAVLELVRNTGVVAGAAGVGVMVLAIWSAARLLVDTHSRAMRALGAGFLGVAIMGVTTGNFPVLDVGFFMWAMGGWLAALRLAELDAAAELERDAGADAAPPLAPLPGRLLARA